MSSRSQTAPTAMTARMCALSPHCVSTAIRKWPPTCDSRQRLSRAHAQCRRGECRACHTEHKGRDGGHRAARAVSQFDHRLTEFALEGAHAALDCEAAHKRAKHGARRRRRASAATKPTMSTTGSSPSPAPSAMDPSAGLARKFDHDKTQFRLTGAHSSMACNACHIGGCLQTDAQELRRLPRDRR